MYIDQTALSATDVRCTEYCSINTGDNKQLKTRHNGVRITRRRITPKVETGMDAIRWHQTRCLFTVDDSPPMSPPKFAVSYPKIIPCQHPPRVVAQGILTTSLAPHRARNGHTERRKQQRRQLKTASILASSPRTLGRAPQKRLGVGYTALEIESNAKVPLAGNEAHVRRHLLDFRSLSRQ